MKNKQTFVSLLIVVCALATLMDGAILGADDGTVARIERDLPLGLKTMLLFFGNTHHHYLSGWLYLLYLIPATFFIVNKNYPTRLSLVFASIHAFAAALVSQMVVRLSSMHVGDGSVLSFVLGVLFWWLLVFTMNMVVAFCFAGLFWVLRALANTIWQLASKSIKV